MPVSRCYFHWSNRAAASFHRSAVSLHSHTSCSRETLDCLPYICSKVPGLDAARRSYERWFQNTHGYAIDYGSGWWTPPLAPLPAWKLESAQIGESLGLRPLVSLTDHDNIEAAQRLRVMEETRHAPISVEWSVPLETELHVGIHNLPVERAAGILSELAAFTARPVRGRLGEILKWLHSLPEVLIVVNHPLWDEKRKGTSRHASIVRQFIETYRPFLHALELNGLRRWKENCAVMALAAAHGLPYISGGDRHAKEPNANLNLTNAPTFAAFVEEVRKGHSTVLFLPQYREPMPVRILSAICDILADDPQHAYGWAHWSQRAFYRFPDGEVLSLAECWAGRQAVAVNLLSLAIRLMESRRLRSALRLAAPRDPEIA